MGCAPGDPASGFAALKGAGFEVDGASRSPSFLCRINGRPTPAQDPCVMPPPTTAYWSYWIADRGRSWCYSNAGMLGRNPPRGTVEGWSFVTGSGASAAPRSSTFNPVAGGGTTGTNCDPATTATTAAPKPTSPRPPSAPPAAPTSPSATVPPTSGGPQNGSTGSPTPHSGGSPRPDDTDTGSATDPTVAGETTTPTTAGPTTTTTDGSTTSTDDVEGRGGDTEEPDGNRSDDDGSEEALSTVALADSGRSGPGGPFGTALALGAVAAVAAGAVVVNRRRFGPAANGVGASGNGESPD